LGNQNVVYSEDCLNLNVWSKPQTGEKKKAVMVFIHGGAFDSGTASLPALNGAGLTDQGDVVTVTLK
jgi:carboxylesterase type B